MKQYKLLKDLPRSLKGSIIPENSIEDLAGNIDPEKFPEWFEEVKDEFKKDFTILTSTTFENNIHTLRETFETKEQVEAMKELKCHIYKFDEPKTGSDCYVLQYDQRFTKFSSFDGEYGYDIRDLIGYNGGYIVNINTTKEDREERIMLLKKAYKI
jgi:hypothetical protein